MADIAKFHAGLPLLNDDPERRRGYLLLEADFRHSQGDSAREAEARLLAAETYVEEADDNARRNPPSYLAASSSLAKGIEVLRGARIMELRRRLKDYQKRSVSEMQTFRTPVDTREVCEASARYVTADDFRRSVILLALGVDVVNVEELKKDTIEAINQAPLLHFGKESMLDEEGRFVAHKESILGLTGEAADKELEKRMFEHARNYKWK